MSKNFFALQLENVTSQFIEVFFVSLNTEGENVPFLSG